MLPAIARLVALMSLFAMVSLPSVGNTKRSSSPWEGQKVQAVRIEGLIRVDQEAVLARIRVRPGQIFEQQGIGKDIRSIFATGLFRDIQLYTVSASSGLELIYRLVEKPSIRSIRITGRESLSEEDVNNVVDVKVNTILKIEKLKRISNKIKELYLNKGYYLADVDFRIKEIAQTNEVDVTFVLTENNKVLVRQILLVGNKHLSSDLIKMNMQTKEGNEISWITQQGIYKEEDFQTDLMRIQALYYDHGFVEVNIGQPTATISEDRKSIYLTVPIEEGSSYQVGRITFRGDTRLVSDDGVVQIDPNHLAQQVALKTSERFQRSKLFQDMESIAGLYKNQGYAYVNVTPNSNIESEEKVIHLEFEISKGEQIYYERIDISGNTQTRDKVIRREITLVEGDRYSGQEIEVSKARIYRLGFFESVEINTDRGTNADSMIVTIEVKEKSTGKFQVGLGLNSFENLIGNAEIAQNNFLGHGQSLSLNAQLSFGQYARQIVSFSFFEPYFLDSLFSLQVSASFNQQLFRDFQRNVRGGSFMFSFPITPELRFAAGYTLEKVRITTAFAQDNNLFDESITESDKRSTVWYPLLRAGLVSSLNSTLSYDSRNNRITPTSGMYHELRGEASLPQLGADRSMEYKRLELVHRFYHPLAWSIVAKANLQLGWIFGSPGGVPISERYFPGGIYSVRGFDPRSLAPTRKVPLTRENPLSPTKDFIVGGTKQAVFNAELEFPVVPPANIRGVLFVDAGNAFDENEQLFYLFTPKIEQAQSFLLGSNLPVYSPLGLYYSVGFGFRWLSPMGPLRFEWAIPITKRFVNSRDVVFEFTIGNLF